MENKAGELLEGRYELIKLLGEGGMGQVYEGKHVVTGRRVAVKFLLTELADNEEMIQRFYREAQAATAIGSEHICEVLDMSPPAEGKSPFLVMEYLDGESLKERIVREKVLPLTDATNIMLQMLEALYAAHKAGIVHRDIKPENIFLVQREDKPIQVKLLDFGISKFNPLGGDNDHSLTKTGTVLGTPYYMSPEQASGDRNVGPLSDLYATGVILYELLTGRVPFDAESFSALVVKIVTHTPYHPSDLNPNIPRELGDLVVRAMARNSADRFATAKDMAEALRAVASGQAIPIHAINAAEASFAAVALPSQGSGSFQAMSVSGINPVYGGNSSSGSFTTSDPSLQTQTPMAMSRSVTGGSGGARTWMIVVGVMAVLIVLGGAVGAIVSFTGLGGGESVATAVPPPPPPIQSDPPQIDNVSPPVVSPPVALPGQSDVVATADAGATAPSGDAAPEVAPTKVRVTVTAQPHNASIYIDDQLVVGNPVEVELPVDAAAHTVRAEAEGYRSASEEFTADENTRIELALQQRHAASGPPTRPPHTTAPPPAEHPTKTPGSRPRVNPVSGVVDPWGNR